MKIIGFTPVFERVLVEPDKVEETTEAGLVLPIESRKRPNSGKIISIGHLVQQSGCTVTVGDHILYQKYSGFDIEIDGKLYHIIMANDIIGIIDNSTGNKFELKDYGA